MVLVTVKYPAQHKNVHLHSNAKKAGLGGAYLSGMKVAFGELCADVIFEFDADFSHDPTKIPDFLQKIDEGYDFVLGSRYIPGGSIPENWGFHRKFLSIVGNLFINVVLTNFSIRD
jgi:dolichol-phosphate mannosyltransferase